MDNLPIDKMTKKQLIEKIDELTNLNSDIQCSLDNLYVEIDLNHIGKVEQIDSILYNAQIKIDQSEDYKSAYEYLVDNIWECL